MAEQNRWRPGVLAVSALLAVGLTWWIATNFGGDSTPRRNGSTYDAAVSRAAVAARDFLGWMHEVSEAIHPDRIAELVREARHRHGEPIGRAVAELEAIVPPEERRETSERFEAAFVHVVEAFRLLTSERDRPFAERAPALYQALDHVAFAEEAFYHLRDEVPEFRDFWSTRPPAAAASGSDEPAPPLGLLHMQRGGRHGGFTLYVPEDYSADREWPLIVVLHGGSGNGRRAIWHWIGDARRRGYLVLAPNAGRGTWSLEDDEGLLEIVGWMQSQYRLDMDHVLLTGFSDGGTFTIVFGLLHPRLFRALAPIAGVFLPMNEEIGNLPRAAGFPVYLVHGTDDFVFPIERAREAREALASAGARVEYRERPGLSHVYPRSENRRILEWFEALPPSAMPAARR